MFNMFKVGDVVTNVMIVRVTADGWIHVNGSVIFPGDTVYSSGDLWIVEKMEKDGWDTYHLIHMSGQKVRTSSGVPDKGFRLSQQ